MDKAFRGLAFLLAAMIGISCLPAAAQASEYTPVSQLSSGEYLLVAESGWAMGELVSEDDELPWICRVQPQTDNGTVVGNNLPLWTLVVTENGVTLRDRNGVFIAPAPEGQNGIVSGQYHWQAEWDGTMVTFQGLSGETPVVLAQNGEAGFRAYDKALTDEGGYPCRFTLYRLSETEPEDTPPTETEPVETKPEETLPEPPGQGLYFGQLHSHSALSDGSASPSALYDAAIEQGLDFLAITDHSNSLDDAQWAAGKEAAQTATGNRFVGIWGYEMSWPSGMGLGHISTFNTPGFLSFEQADFNTYDSGLQNYYAALTAEPNSISQFNHPGTFYGDFRDFSFYRPEYDSFLNLLEVFCGDGLPDALAGYDRALELGWHVAPTAGSTHDTAMGENRTVVFANSLTEEGIYHALKNYRVYATQDSDLSILYYLDGHFMGSRLLRQNMEQTMTLQVSLSDPTDAIGTVEVIAGGASIARETVEGHSGTAEFSLPTARGSYYIRISQPDGQIAVTAPIWIEGEECAGISSLSADTQTPVQGQLLNLTLELYNQESAELVVNGITLTIGGETLYAAETTETLLQGQTKNLTLPLVYSGLGYTGITATVTATLDGQPRTYTQTLTLSFRKPEMVTSLLADGTHGTIPNTEELTALAAASQISVTLETQAITPEMLQTCSILLIPAPQTPFEEAFLTMVQDFARQGGTVFLCAQSDAANNHAAGELNRLLKALGSTMSFRDDTARDEENNSKNPTHLYLTSFNTSSVWIENVTSDQIYRHIDGCTVDPGQGTWLVKGNPTTCAVDGDGDGLGGGSETVVLACEGNLFAAGTCFLSNEDLALPESIWAEAYANRTIVQNLLGGSEPQMPLSSIADVRSGEMGETYRIRGYVTSGTSNPYNTFPNTLYLQDDTGGIAVAPFRETGIAVGTPMDVTGYLNEEAGNKVFRPISCKVLDAAPYRYLPTEAPWNELLDNSLHGGQFVVVEGSVMGIEYGTGRHISGLYLEDDRGNYALVHIEDCIRSGDTGEHIPPDAIEEGYTVRAMGILYLREDGVSAVRVRNCDEVVYVPPIRYYWKPARKDNPRVGDDIGIYVVGMLLSGGALLHRRKRRCKGNSGMV